MVLLVGQVPTGQPGPGGVPGGRPPRDVRAARQGRVPVDDPDRAPELVARAMVTAVSGEPGPVVLELPEDVLSTPTAAPVVPAVPPVVPAPARDDVDAFVRALTARRAAAAGRRRLRDGPSTRPSRVRRFAEAAGIPLATAVRHQDLVDHRSPVFVGTLGLNTTAGLAAAVADADVLAFVGTRPDALTVDDFELLDVPVPQAEAAPRAPGSRCARNRSTAPTWRSSPGPARFAAALPVASPATPTPWLARLRENYLRGPAPSVGGGVHAGAGRAGARPDHQHRRRRVHGVAAAAPPVHDATRRSSAPSPGPWASGCRPRSPRSSSTRTGSAVAFAGDGCFLMTGQELSTAVRYGLAPLVVVVNNGSYGTIRDHQRAGSPAASTAPTWSTRTSPRTRASFGAHGERVRTPDEFAAALDRMLGARRR